MEDDEIDFSKVKAWFKKKAADAKMLEEHEDSHSTETKSEHHRHVAESHSPTHEHKHAPIHSSRELKKGHHHDSAIHHASQDDELSIDFSKVKSFFKKHLKTEESDSLSSDDSSLVDFSKAKTWMKNFRKKDHSQLRMYLVPALLFVAVFFAIFLRAVPAHLPVTDIWARQTVENGLSREIGTQIQAQYPTLPQQNIDSLARQQFDAFKRQNKAQLLEQEKLLSQQFRERLQLDGQTYLTGIDPEFWMLHANNILEHGHPGDTLRNPVTRALCNTRSKDCVPWDDHMYAPLGREVPPDMLHSYAIAYAHKVVTLFSPRTPLLTTIFYFPVILGALCVIPAFFIARRIGGNFGGFVAALLVGIHPAFLARTVGGFADTDAYNIFFPLLILWAFLAAQDSSSLKKVLGLSALAGLLLGVYTRVWSAGWWYIAGFILLAMAMYIVFVLLVRKSFSSLRPTLVSIATFGIIGLLSILTLSGPALIFDALRAPFSFIQLKEISIESIWPNVFTTVAEQAPASLAQIISNVGFDRVIFLLIGLLGIALTMVRKKPDKMDLYYASATLAWYFAILVTKPESLLIFLVLMLAPIVWKLWYEIMKKQEDLDLKTAFTLLIWFVATFYASTKGIRYLILLVPAFSIGFGIAWGLLYKYASNWMSDALHLNAAFARTIALVLLIAVMIPPFSAANSYVSNQVPLMNDAWYDSLDRIAQESSPNAIITSWWDYGHWFKNIADRAVTFDGTSQNSPMAHWVGSALLTSNEEETVGILRMLDCGSILAFDTLNARVKDGARSVDLLHAIVALPKEKARTELIRATDEQTANEVLKYTHCDAPEAFFITSDDMIPKSPVWSHFGAWDFDKALIYQKAQQGELTTEYLKGRFNYSDDTAQRVLFEAKGIRTSEQANNWIAPWLNFGSGLVACNTRSPELVLCPLNTQTGAAEMRVNLTSGDASVSGATGENRPDVLLIPTPKGMIRKTYSEKTLGFSMVMVPNEGTWSFIVMQTPLEESMFTKLFLLNGHGLRHFELFSDQTSVVGNRILVWRVLWEPSEKRTLFPVNATWTAP